MSGSEDILKGYAEEAADIIPRFEGLSPEDVLAPVLAFLPAPPARVADIGAGTGRDANWFASQGYRVTAVEPVAELAAYGASHHSPAIRWCDDRLPGLPVLRADGDRFDLIFVGSVWHHLTAEDSRASLVTLAGLLHPGGRLVVSLKVFAATGANGLTRDALARHIDAAGLVLRYEQQAGPHQDHNKTAGNMWTWLVMERPQRGAP